MHFISAAALETLSQLSLQPLSPDPDPAAPGFGLAVLSVSPSSTSSPPTPSTRRSALPPRSTSRTTSALAGPPPPPPTPPPIPDAEKNQIKALILSPMLKVPRRIRPQLSEALSIVSSHDFPLSWPSLLPELVSNLRSAANYSTVNGLLGAANSLLLKFRHSTDTSALCLDLKYCLDGFATPLPEVFVKAAQFISANATASSPDVLCPFFECQRLCCRIFHSLNSIELPEFFDDHMWEWMTEFRSYFTTTNSPAVETEGTTDALRAAICENLQPNK